MDDAMEGETNLAPADTAGNTAGDYTYLTLPPNGAMRSCIGLVLAGLAARARIGVGGLEEAVGLLEGQHSAKGPTRYRFSLKDEGLVAEVEEPGGASTESGSASGWRTVVEMVS